MCRDREGFITDALEKQKAVIDASVALLELTVTDRVCRSIGSAAAEILMIQAKMAVTNLSAIAFLELDKEASLKHLDAGKDYLEATKAKLKESIMVTKDVRLTNDPECIKLVLESLMLNVGGGHFNVPES